MDVFSINKAREKTFQRGDFELSLKLDDAFIFFEAFNSKTNNYYTAYLTNKTIEEFSQHLFSNIEDLYEVLCNSLEAKNNSKPNGIYVKFNKKEVYIFLKIEFSLPIKKSNSFYIYLKPQSFGAPTKKIHLQMEELNKKVSQLEKMMESHVFSNNLLEKINKVELFLEKKTSKKEVKEVIDLVNLSPQQNKPNGIKKSSFLFKNNEIQNETAAFNKSANGEENLLVFDSKHNTNYFKYKENSSYITRNSVDKKQHVLAWGSIPFKKNSKENYFFTVKIEKLNPEFEIINACVGIMGIEGLTKISNLADHDGQGCYLYGIGTQFFWINNVKTKISHKYGRLNDLIKISLNFSEKKIRWKVNDIDIGFGDLDDEQIDKFEFYPVVTLAFNKESVSIKGYMKE